MEKTSANSPFDQTIEQYKRDLMAVYHRSRTPQPPIPAPAPEKPAPSVPAAAPSGENASPSGEHTPAPDTPEHTGDDREMVGTPPDNSGTPRDAVGRDEPAYRAAAEAFLKEVIRRLAAQGSTSSANNSNHTTNNQNFQPSGEIKTEYDQFESDYPGHGVIKTQVFTARRTYPVENAQVNLYKVFSDGSYLIDSQFTDSSGQVNPVTVPAMNRSLSESPGNADPYLSYRITVSHPDFLDAAIDQVPVFEGVVSLQAVDLIPAAAAPVPNSGYTEYPVQSAYELSESAERRQEKP